MAPLILGNSHIFEPEELEAAVLVGALEVGLATHAGNYAILGRGSCVVFVGVRGLWGPVGNRGKPAPQAMKPMLTKSFHTTLQAASSAASVVGFGVYGLGPEY